MTKAERIKIWNDNFHKWNAISDNDETWIVIGNTFEIKDELKAKGAKFCYELGWHFDHEEPGYVLVKITLDEIAEYNFEGKLFFREEASQITKELQKKNTIYEPSKSEWVGTEGFKLKTDVILKSVRQTSTYYGLSNIYTFEDENENIIIWFTSLDIPCEKDHKYFLVGTVKKHAEFRGQKQTNVTRCKLHEVFDNE